MTITSDITASDLRVLYWRIMLPEWMRLGFAIALPGAIMWLCLARAEGSDLFVALRYVGRLLLWVLIGLSLSFLWSRFTSRKEWANWMRAVGKYTYELEDRTLIVTDADGRREFPTKVIQRVEETPERIFVLMRQGPHYIIPRAGLTSEQQEAVKSFREAVAFASLHVEMLHRNQMPREEAISELKMARWVAAGCVLALPFTFGNGLLPILALVIAILCGGALLFGVVSSWRSRHRGLLVAVLVVWLIGPSMVGGGEESFRAEWVAQWLCLAGCSATLPLVLFSRFFRRVGKLDEPDPV